MLPTHSFVDEVEKIALGRLEKEVAAGRVRLSDVPGLPAGATMQQARKSFLAPAAVSPERLARTRRLNEALFRAQSNLTPEQLGSLGKNVGAIHRRMIPGMGPGMAMGQVFVPETTGRFIRTAPEKRGLLRASLGSLSSHFPALERVMVPPAPMDPTLNKALLSHEFGEAGEFARMMREMPAGATPAQIMREKAVTPVSSHLGVQPILEEQIGLRGDPEAIRKMQQVRAMEQGDVTVQKAIRQAGGTPDRPLPVGGKSEAAVRRIVSRDPRAIGQVGRTKAFQMTAVPIMMEDMFKNAPGGFNPPPPPVISYKVPEVRPYLEQLKGLRGAAEGAVQAPGLMGKLRGMRGVVQKAREMAPAGKLLSKWLKFGV